MNSIADEVAAGLTKGLAPVVENAINTLFAGIGISKSSPLLTQLSGKSIEIDIGTIKIKIPDLPKQT
jgi:hypothetical protein